MTDPRGAEPEHPDCLVAVFPQSAHFQQWKLPGRPARLFRPSRWQGQPNVLSPSRVEWRWAEAAEEMVGKPAGQGSGDRDQETGVREQDRDRTQEPGNISFIAPHHPPAAERAGDGRADGDRAGCVLPDAAAHDARPGLRRSPCCPGRRASIWRSSSTV